MQFDQYGKPVPSTTRSRWKDLGEFVLTVVLLVGALMFLAQLVREPALKTIGTADATPVIIVASDPLPPEVVQAAVALATSLAPTPTRTPAPETPTVAPAYTPVCEAMVDAGVCTWAEPPEPTGTPIPICDTPVPFQVCYKERKGFLGNSFATPVGTPVPD